VDASQVEKLANLARLEISRDTIAEVSRSINDVLALVDQLKAAKTEGVAPMAHPLDAEQVLRADAVTEPNVRDAFLAIAPACENGLYLVPNVIE
jgi:aspartyl-tRNA(Asn)/glutamyl-tRNA(Gln) amidotransferase subunit C